MRFTGCVAYQEGIGAPAPQPYTGANWSGSEPRPNPHRPTQSILYSDALAPQIGLHNRTGLFPRKCSPASIQPIPANATCDGSGVVIGNHHAAVTASK
jgi:hypothetical protein